MKIINNTAYNITLVNGKVIKRYDSVTVLNVSEELLKQLENLQKEGVVRTEL